MLFSDTRSMRRRRRIWIIPSVCPSIQHEDLGRAVETQRVLGIGGILFYIPSFAVSEWREATSWGGGQERSSASFRVWGSLVVGVPVCPGGWRPGSDLFPSSLVLLFRCLLKVWVSSAAQLSTSGFSHAPFWPLDRPHTTSISCWNGTIALQNGRGRYFL